MQSKVITLCSLLALASSLTCGGDTDSGGQAGTAAGPLLKLDTAAIQQLTGAMGAMNDKEGVFKVSVPRSDLAVLCPR